MTTERVRQRAFRRLLARETGNAADARTVAAAARCLCERLALQLTPIIGEVGIAAIYDRSLHLTQRRFESPGSVPATGGDAPSTRVELFLQPMDPDTATTASVTVLTTISELLASFIGGSLTTYFLREAWPDEFADEAEETAP